MLVKGFVIAFIYTYMNPRTLLICDTCSKAEYTRFISLCSVSVPYVRDRLNGPGVYIACLLASYMWSSVICLNAKNRRLGLGKHCFKHDLNMHMNINTDIKHELAYEPDS